jgi:1-acyl-sn-glycerol-3-phosphate acyltransferase
MTAIRSALFLLWFALVTTLMSLAFIPVLIFPWWVCAWMARQWCRLTFLGLRVFAGLGYEVRGTVPQGRVLVASKHMSMWDTMALFMLLWNPATVVKRELMRIPFYGWYLWRAGMIPIDRSAGASALRKMSAAAESVFAQKRPVIIFPEGTRKKPHAPPDYKPGVAALYGQVDAPCVPVALNSGLFWTGPMGFVKKRGTVVIEFLPAIPAGLPRREFLTTLEQRIEAATAALVVEGEALLARESGVPARA